MTNSDIDGLFRIVKGLEDEIKHLKQRLDCLEFEKSCKNCNSDLTDCSECDNYNLWTLRR